ncbi:hypothetical protein [Spirosoma endophyticum]|uniref:hypothetical protein n=1 Tax=Spirosoma endophyticum TaxID=662367 RepID=UPI0011602B21|nr:hypothetical protein [Spirosoma endophyticum]
MFTLVFSGYCPKDSVFVKTWHEEPLSRYSSMVSLDKMKSEEHCFQEVERLTELGWEVTRMTIFDSDRNMTVRITEQDRAGKSMLECIKDIRKENEKPLLPIVNTFVKRLIGMLD